MYIILLGMLAKATGQILRVAACLQMLFCDEAGPGETITIKEPIPKDIREDVQCNIRCTELCGHFL